jgi:hypothetical protein
VAHDPDAPVDDADRRAAARLASTADRLDELAEVAELMGDTGAAQRFRSDGSSCRARAMSLLDE